MILAKTQFDARILKATCIRSSYWPTITTSISFDYCQSKANRAIVALLIEELEQKKRFLSYKYSNSLLFLVFTNKSQPSRSQFLKP